MKGKQELLQVSMGSFFFLVTNVSCSLLLNTDKQICSFQEISLELNSCDKLDNAPASRNTVSGSTVLNLVKVKAEPLDNNESDTQGRNAMGNFSFNIVHAKSELELSDELNRDSVDHMQLRNRMNLQIPRADYELNSSGNYECQMKIGPSVDNDPAPMEASNTVRINRPRKRKKTAT